MTERIYPKGTDPIKLTRRRFLGRTAAISGAIAAPLVIPSLARGASGNVAPSNRLGVGLIGKGIMGSGHLRRLVGDRDVQVLGELFDSNIPFLGSLPFHILVFQPGGKIITPGVCLQPANLLIQ